MAYMISLSAAKSIICLKMLGLYSTQGCISCGTCSYLELTEDHVLTSAYVKIFRIVTRNAVNKSFWRKKDCSWPPLNKYAMNIWLSSLKIRAHLSWRTGKHLHVLHVLRTYSTCSCPGQQDTTTYAALRFCLFVTRPKLPHTQVSDCPYDRGCISCGILVSGIRARGVSSEHMENMEMFSCSPT